MHGKKKLLWGLPRGRHRWEECRALLQEHVFGSAAEFVACAGPLALFRALVDGDVFYDETPVWTYGKHRGELYPVRFNFTRVTELNRNWYTRGDNSWRLVLLDLWQPKPSCLFEPRSEVVMSDPGVDQAVLFAPVAPSVDPTPPSQRQIAPHPEFRPTAPVQLRADDGHFVRSKSELTICNWLYHHHVPHAYERRLPIPESVFCDFYIDLGDGCYIEHWGLDSAAYQKRREEKLSLYQRHRLNLLELQEADIARLDDVLPRKLHRFGISVK